MAYEGEPQENDGRDPGRGPDGGDLNGRRGAVGPRLVVFVCTEDPHEESRKKGENVRITSDI